MCGSLADPQPCGQAVLSVLLIYRILVATQRYLVLSVRTFLMNNEVECLPIGFLAARRSAL